MTVAGSRALDTLLAGNERFRTGSSSVVRYSRADLERLAVHQEPIAAILACSDSRYAPEIVFDQPLGSVFSARTPGNVSADSVKWMIDIAVDDLQVPLFLVVAHTGCLAVTQVVNGEFTGPGGPLRTQISAALTKAKSANPPDLLRATIEENVFETIARLTNESYELRRAVESGRTQVAGAVYDMHTGTVHALEPR
jgi:carbonic anhydrase